MITVQGPAAAIGIAVVLQLMVESSVYIRERARDLRAWRAHRRRHGSLPAAWSSSQGERLGRALAKQRPGR